jgi:putative membrane protein
MLFLATFLSPTISIAHTNGDGHGYGHDMWGGMGFGPIVMIVVIAAAVALIILLVRWLGGVDANSEATPSAPKGIAPLDILKKRYAQGEIDKDEFEERRRTLGD